MRAILLLVLGSLVLPGALAQEHAHGGGAGGAVVLFDGPPSGRAVVGAYTHFGFALLDEDGAPVVHQDAAFTVRQNGRTLFATNDTHEYDGLFSFDMVFAEIGPYVVEAMSGDMPLGRFEGEVLPPVDERVATVQLTQSGTAFELAIVDADGKLLEHTDAIIEFRTIQGDALHARTHLHIHDAPIRFSQTFFAGDHVAHVVAYKAFATGRGPDVRAVYATFPVTATAPAPAVPALPTPAAPEPLEQRGARASADGLTLHAMYDPNNQVGVAQLARIAGAVTLDANATTLQHVDFALTLSGPAGLVFSSESGHEYDGVFEYVFRPAAPGAYKGTMVATYGDTRLEVPVELIAVPPIVPALGGTGLITIGVEGLDGLVAGKEAALTFSAMGSAGPAAHSEVDVTVFQEGEAPLYQFKLHTHGSGLTAATLLLPRAGAWALRVDPLPTIPEASLYVSTLFTFDVAERTSTLLPLEGDAQAAAASVPGAWPALTLGGLVAALALARRRR